MDSLPKILLVEDLQDTIKIVKIMCAGCYQIDSAGYIEEALEKISSNSYDMILMDINLKQPMDGIMLAKILKEQKIFVNKPIIAFTAYYMTDDEDNLREAGMDGFIQKPVMKKELLKRIAEYI
ncbi:MAG: response regulator [bacterium]